MFVPLPQKRAGAKDRAIALRASMTNGTNELPPRLARI